MSLSANLLKLVAKLTVDSSEYDFELKKSADKAHDWGSKLSTGLKVAAGVGTAAFSAMAVAVKNVTEQAVNNYASFEQLEGGVKKLYGSAADELMGYAEKAYQTSGMSANRYMEQATTFSAALINALDGDTSAAAKQTDVAMRAISDNWNTFGGDIQNVENAYAGFARGQFNMLDNLKLGYSGTKQGMQDLIDDANEYAKANGMAADLSIDNFSDIVTAIDLVQQKQGIAGTTAKEAATTIEGSLNMTKAAWENVITSLGRGEGIEDAFKGLTNSIFGEKEGEGLLNQIIPRIEETLKGVGDFIVTASPLIIEKIPELIDQLLPAFVSTVSTLVKTLGEALPGILSSLSDIIMTEGINLLKNLADGLRSGLPEFLKNVLPMLVSFTEELRNNFGQIIDAGIEVIMALVDGLIAGLPYLIEYIPEIIINIAGLINDNMPKILEAGVKIIIALVEGIIQSMPIIIENFGKIVEAIFSVIQAVNWINLGSEIIRLIGSGLSALASTPVNIIKNIGQNVVDTFKNGFSWSGLGRSIIDGIVAGIRGAGDAIKNILMNLAKSAWKGVKDFFGIASPSKLMRDTIGKFIPLGMAEGIEDEEDSVVQAMRGLSDLATDSFNFQAPTFDSGASNGFNAGGVTINVYGAEGQSAIEIAEEVGRILTDNELRRRASYA